MSQRVRVLLNKESNDVNVAANEACDVKWEVSRLILGDTQRLLVCLVQFSYDLEGRVVPKN
eukprot:CAMPEP_0178723940 /NCGR_PEP_ID=MMETSP0699-20121125/25828_1 /TAXON_ID=265572 /ORGANISM="Extubocellulus spinifer, Strain CCMP396" /LENGTH=60 /DNA_ID=CAMNT_0020375081 /DNA_START=91 /DNA_END=273 /DNA_ORIENTATION=+